MMNFADMFLAAHYLLKQNTSKFIIRRRFEKYGLERRYCLGQVRRGPPMKIDVKITKMIFHTFAQTPESYHFEAYRHTQRVINDIRRGEELESQMQKEGSIIPEAYSGGDVSRDDYDSAAQRVQAFEYL